MITYRTTPDQWSPGYLAAYIYDDGRFAVVIDGRPVFSGTGYKPGPWHDDRMQVADVLFFASLAVDEDGWHGDGYKRRAGGGRGYADDLAAIGDDLEQLD